MAYGIFYFVFFYVIILAIFIFCYWRILTAIRRHARVMAGHGATARPSTAAQSVSHQIQTNVTKTMILVSAFYAISDMPMSIYYLLLKGKARQVKARQDKEKHGKVSKYTNAIFYGAHCKPEDESEALR